MSRINHQRQLDFGVEDHIRHHHVNNTSGVVIAYITPETERPWHEKTQAKERAIQMAKTLPLAHVDSYMGQNAFQIGRQRCYGTLTRLLSCYVDLDTYNTPYKHYELETILDIVRERLPGLPMPTYGGSSGRGYQLSWCFVDCKSKDYLPTWQIIEDALVSVFKEFGADSRARDCARVLRLSGTENTKAHADAQLYPIGEFVKYEKLLTFANKYHQKEKSQQKHLPQKSIGAKAKLYNYPTKNAYTLAHDRMQDLEKLCQMRGPLENYRRRAVFYYACSASYFFKDVESLRREIDCFIHDNFANPEQYKSSFANSVITRFEQNEKGIKIKYNGKSYDARYRYRNQTIIDDLDITEFEQTQFKTIIGKQVKYSRKVKARRDKGVIPRNEYEALASAKQKQIQSLHKAGHSQREIANMIECSRGTVRYHLSSDTKKLTSLGVG